MLTTTAVATMVGVLAILARLAAIGRRSTRFARFADVLLLFAGAAVLGAVALPQAWTPAVLEAPPLKDPRLGGAIALGVASLLAALALLPEIAAAGSNAVSAMAPLAMGAAAAPTLMYFWGLHGERPLTVLALGGATLGFALFALPLLRHGAGRARGAVLASGMALLAIGAALSVCGARTSWPDAEGIRAGSVLTGPALIVRPPSATAAQHPVVWLAKGDSVTAGPASLRFLRFRIEQQDGIHMYADIEVRHGGATTIVSPVVHASSQGEQPMPVAVQGVGSILIVGMDADHGRVALLVPGVGDQPAPSPDRFTLARRPGLELAWAGLILSLASLLPMPRKRTLANVEAAKIA